MKLKLLAFIALAFTTNVPLGLAESLDDKMKNLDPQSFKKMSFYKLKGVTREHCPELLKSDTQSPAAPTGPKPAAQPAESSK